VHRMRRPKAASDQVGVQHAANASLIQNDTISDATRTYLIDDQDAQNTSFRGPMRAPTNVRSTLRIDYQPDVCKDYKDTGYCGYGDACKFMHDRGDYLSGWQMEEKWNKKQEDRKKRFMKGLPEDEEDEDKEKKGEDFPWGCFICRSVFKNAVVTKCKHYFCEQCALQRYTREKQKACYICLNPTNGIFNICKELHDIEAIERAIARVLAPHLELEDTVPTADVLAKAETQFGENSLPAGTTEQKLRFIEEKLGLTPTATGKQLTEEEADAAELQTHAAELAKKGKAWRKMDTTVTTWAMPGSSQDPAFQKSTFI